MTAAPAASHFGLLHEIFILDAYLKGPLDASKQKPITEGLIHDLLTALRMEELGELQIYPAADERAPGWSFLQPITTSHISGHYFQKPGDPHIRMDIYSCASVNWRKVIQIVNKHLGLSQWRASFIDRQIDEGSRLLLDISGHDDTVVNEVVVHLDDPATTSKIIKHRDVSVATTVS